eukprot:1802823-Lingulodinium_polyedra.AAC.1
MAAKWMRLWHRQDRAERAAKLPRKHTGPGTARDRPGRALTSARRLFRPRQHQGLRAMRALAHEPCARER